MTSALSLSPAKPEGPSPSMSPLGGVSRTSRASFQAGAQRRDSSPPKEGRRGSRSTFDADEIQGMRKLSQMSADGRRGSVRTAEEEAVLEQKMKDAKEQRRNTAMKRFSVTGAADIGNALSALISAASNREGPVDPETQLTDLMIAAKASGMEVKTLFEYFDKNNVRARARARRLAS